MINREAYLNQLLAFKDKQLIKVVSGIRRCGKSTLFELYKDCLLARCVDEKQIISINLESAESYDIKSFAELYHAVAARLDPSRMNYVFLDEVQLVPDFQRACDSLYIMKNVDLYITGSNAGLLSGELATLLSGRYVEIKMLPLSFKEYISAVGTGDLSRKYRDYLLNSSFPYALELSRRKDILAYLDGIYTSIVLKDIVKRKKITDIAALESVIRFMFDNIGNLCSATKIANTLKSGGKNISAHTVDNYLNALCESFVLYRVGRYDIKGKQFLQTQEKFYLADIGLRYYLLGTKPADMGHILENIVYLELLRRGNEIYVGKQDNGEVDFVAINDISPEYYQVALTVRDETTLKRELAPLNRISDHNPKFLLTLDDDPPAAHNGIRQINAIDWLIGK
ncbi:ATP-binding protein [Succinimonas sp.]|uniref:ATP-binding protein n=1 Tax=Succinimonas sp. TaxID=1936151 RepID=UPI0038688CB8